jgi:hypothetical protein
MDRRNPDKPSLLFLMLLQGVDGGKAEMCERADRFVQHNSAEVEHFLEVNRRFLALGSSKG